ncbi:uncharacterized mitochondrial protein-like protein [Tanacetum coccineum]
MSDPKFADTHNLVAFLEKPTKSEGFEEIVDFMNANPIKYALTVNPTIYCSCIKQFWDTIKAKMVNREVQLQALVDKKKKLTFYKAFFSPQWKFSIHTILQCLSAKTTAWNEFSSTMAFVIICLAIMVQAYEEMGEVNTLGSGEDRLSLKELMDLCTKLSNRVLDLETTKTAQAKELASLKKRFKKLERKRKSKTLRMKRLFKIGRAKQVVSSKDKGLGDQEDASKQERKIAKIDADAEVTLIDETQRRNDDNLIFDTGVLDEQETLIEIKAAKPKVRGVMIQEPSEFTTTTTTTTPTASKPSHDKGKEKMIESEEPLKMKLKDQVLFVENDYELAQRLQAKEQEELSTEEKSKLFQQLLEKRRKHFTAKRVGERISKLPTKAQQRSIMTPYLKNMGRIVGIKSFIRLFGITAALIKVIVAQEERVNAAVYVDDIIFRSTKKELCFAIEKLMHEKFQMSSMGELTFFLGLQVKQKKDGIFISQEKYVEEILKKFGFTEVKTASTPMETQKPLLKDKDGEEIPSQSKAYTDSDYAGVSLDKKSTTGGCQFLGCRLISWQCKKQTVVANSTTEAEEVQLHAQVDGNKIIISEASIRRDLQLEDAEGVDYLPNSIIFEQLTLMGLKTIAWNEFSSTMASAIICLATNQKFNFSKYIFESMVRNLDNLFGKFMMYPRKPKIKDTRVPQPSDPSENVTNEAIHKELGDSLVRPTTTTSSLEAEQDIGNITKTRSKATPNESSSLGTTLGGGPRCQETIRDTIAQTRFENVSKLSNDSLLARGNTLRSDKDRLKLDELMALCTTLQKKVLDLDKTKTTQANEIASLKRRVKKLEKKDRSRTHKLKRLYKVGLTARVESSSDEEDLDDADNEIFYVNVLNGEEVFVARQNENVVEEAVDAAQVSIAVTTVTITTEEITLAQALEALKTSKPKDKGKGISIEEPVKPMKKKVQIMLDEEAALKLQAEFDKKERLAREKAEKEKKPILL